MARESASGGKTVPIDDLLERAADSAQTEAWPACLSALLEAWRAAADPRLAALIDKVSPRAAGPEVGGSGALSRVGDVTIPGYVDRQSRLARTGCRE